MLDPLQAFALAQCMHYATALVEERPPEEVELTQIACEVTSYKVFGAPLKLKLCTWEGSSDIVCYYEFEEM